MTLDEVKILCVTPFLLSKTRFAIMAGLEQLLHELTSFGISAEVWIDGSFVTKKIDLADVDIVFCVDAALYDHGTLQTRQALDAINTADHKAAYSVHSFVFYDYAVDHPFHEVGLQARTYWTQQFGYSRRREVKGMPVIRIP